MKQMIRNYVFPVISVAVVLLYVSIIAAIFISLHIGFDLSVYLSATKGESIPNFNKLLPEMRQILEDLSRQNFFRYFRVDTSRECPFQVSDALCTSKVNCQLTCECPLDKLPKNWLQEDLKQKENLAFSPIKMYDVMKPHYNGIDPWSFDLVNENTIYVDLLTDKEQFTGYQGQKIWNMIYEENCMSLSRSCGGDNFLFKVISGMHTSVSSHLSEYFIDFKRPDDNARPNELMYHQKVGAFPDRLGNLAFAVQTLVRAYVRYIDLVDKFAVDTGDFGEDMKTKQLLQKLSDLLSHVKDVAFRQEGIFGQKVAIAVQKKAYLQYFRNITQIMDCVDCVKCKVYGKMQILGIGVALRIMLKESGVALTRNELVAFINTMNKWTESLEIVERMKSRLWTKTILFSVGVSAMFAVLYFLASWFLGKFLAVESDKISNSHKIKAD